MKSRALVVEDNPGIYSLIEGMLDSIGFTCLRAQTLADARHLIATEQFDLGLIDLEIPVRRDRFATCEPEVARFFCFLPVSPKGHVADLC